MKQYKIILVIISFAFLFSNHINIEKAHTVAKNLYLDRSGNNDLFNFSISSTDIIRCDNNTNCEGESLFYIFHLSPTGFIIVSADNRTLPVLAYSFENEFQLDGMPDNISGLFNHYKDEITSIKVDKDHPQYTRYHDAQREHS